MDNILILGIGAGLILVLVLIMIVAKLYRRASKELSFVRTGMGGQRVVMNGGSLVLPVFHETIPVNMNTLRLEVRRAAEQALITQDRMRVDVQAEFYVRVKPTKDAIADAAQTLGRRTLDPQALKELVEAKFVDALRAVAAEMEMQELHEQRVDFVQKVQAAVTEDLLKNGLELETVSLTSLDQTDRQHFNPQNAFDAEGLTKLTEEIEARRKLRNDIEQDTQVAVQSKNLEAERQKLDLSREEEYARLEQEREVEVRRADQKAQIAAEQASKARDAQEAEIRARQEVDRTEILARRAVEEERIATEQQLQEREIEKKKLVEAAEIDKQKAIEAAEIEKQRAVEAAEIEKAKLVESAEVEKKRTVEAAEIDKRKTVELADQGRGIAIAEKSRELSESQAEADRARALAVTASEQVETARETEQAERLKRIELIEAAQEAERDAIGITVAAEAEKQAATDHAEAVRTRAGAEADEKLIVAQGEAEAEKVRADAAEKRYAIDAEGQRALHEAENILSDGIVSMRIKLALLENLADVVRESVKPMESIDGIKIVQLAGLGLGGAASSNGNGGSQGGGQATGTGGNLAEQVVSSALQYRAQAPLIDSLMKEVGISGGDLAGLTEALVQNASEGATAEELDLDATPDA